MNKTPEELYQAWRKPEVLGAIRQHFAEVTTLDPERTHWLIKNPFGTKLEWDAQVVEDHPSEFLLWQRRMGQLRFSRLSGNRALKRSETAS